MSKKGIKNWYLMHKGMTEGALELSFRNNCQYTLAKDKYTATDYDKFMSLAYSVRDRLVERWIKTQQRYHRENVKRVYYLSLEFLIGRLLGNNIINLGLWKESRAALENLGIDIEDMREQELDAGLGNGGLGRLAACFLDSMATLNIPAHGYGIRYDYGIFHQKILNGYQIELPDEWLKHGNPWELVRPEYKVKVRFYGYTYNYSDRQGHLRVRWEGTDDVIAMPYDIPVPGYKNEIVNTLRLWSARAGEEFDLDYFNHGDYERAVYNKMFSENISRVLYPNDHVTEGRELRLKQEYFFTAASIADIIRRFKVDNSDLLKFPDRVAIQINDTHPSLAIVELMRILIDEENMDWDTAWNITVNTFAYTNHTVMPEALEKWTVSLFENLLPRHMQLVYEINSRFLREVANKFPWDNDRLSRMSLIEEGDVKRVRMGYLAVVGSHSVNGVSKLHGEIIKKHTFKDFYDFSPEKFNSKTNGITQRRWLKKANMNLSELISSKIGEDWVTDFSNLEKILPLKDDPQFLQEWRKVKRDNKMHLAEYIRKTMGISINVDSMFDVQVKRIHEYKRQLMFALYIVSQYLRVKRNPKEDCVPRTFLFGGKAAPGYFMAKLIIKFINSVADIVNKDPAVRDKFKVVFMENYRVSLAEKIFPASDLSEQISTAGTEASGTGCMKFMINGALTLGTLDGANIEMAEAVGYENMFLFGLKTDEIDNLRKAGYKPADFIKKNEVLNEIIELIEDNFFSPLEPGLFSPIIKNLKEEDPFFVCADFDSYCRAQEEVSRLYRDPEEWAKKSVINVAKSGPFSSDRTIAEYAREIWGIDIA